ncbi:MAG: helix-turn-helix domain-containing protein, partial [Ktedonobacteraceae bacterium]
MPISAAQRQADASRAGAMPDARMLAWLLAYPASSAREIAAAFDVHPATATRALARMQDAGETQRLSGYGGDARFLLTPRGLTRLSQRLDTTPDDLARMWQRGLCAPDRLVPRLVTIDRLHTFARQFFFHAPVQLAQQGHAAVVRWHIARDWRSRVEGGGGRLTTARADALLAWTVEDSREAALSPWAMASEPPRARQWEAAFVLLESGLCDRSLLHARLLRLLHLRASLSHRHRPASLFPPVLMLVENERQAEVWRWVARDAARTERVEELAGAIAILGEQDNPWQWGWRDLATGASLHLAARCIPQPQGALPPGVMAHLAAVQAVQRACDKAERGTEPSVPPVASARRGKLPAVIPPRERGLLTLLARAPLLAAEEIAAVLRREPDHGPLSEATAERRLRDLVRQGLARRDLVAQGHQAAWRWQLTEHGLRQVAAIHDVPLLHLARRVERAEVGSPHVLESRDQFVLQRHGAHLAGVYGVVAAFHRAAMASR